MRIGKRIFIAVIFSMLTTVSIFAADYSKIILAYYPDWAPKFRSENIPYTKLTHICHAFIHPTDDGDINYSATYLEPEMISTAHSKGVKVLISVGGAGAANDRAFKKIAADPVLRKKFIDKLESFIRINGYDGLDLDWEKPSNNQDKANQPILIKEIYEKFHSSPDPAPKWIITMAVNGTNWSGQWVDYDKFIQYVDYINLMAYDMHGDWETIAGHNAALKKGGYPDPKNDVSDELELDYLESRGLPDNKILMGIPFYGHEVLNASDMYGKCADGKCITTHQLNYNKIVPMIEQGWERKWDDKCQVPYLVRQSKDAKWNPMEKLVGTISGMKTEKETGVITYDDPKSIAIKVKYALLERKLAGVFMWDLTADFIDGKEPLMDSMRQAYDEACGQMEKK